MAVHFMPEEIVLTIHADLLQRYGGQPGLRDRGLLELTVASGKLTKSQLASWLKEHSSRIRGRSSAVAPNV